MLLESYYDGSISPQERRVLSDMLTTAKSLPDDIEAEKEIYLSIETPEEIRIPEYLSEKIELAISSASNRKQSFRSHLFYFSGAAAAVILLFSMVWNAVDIAETSMEIPESHATIVAEYTSDDIEIAPSGIPANNPTGDKEEIVKSEFLKTESHPNRQLAATTPSSSKPVSKGNVKEITDPDEAAHILDCVMGILTENMYAAERACDKPDIIIESMNHTLSKTDL